MQPRLVAPMLEVSIDDIHILHPRRFHRPHMIHLQIFASAATLGMGGVIPTKEVLLCAGNAIDRTSRPEHMHMDIASTVCRSGVMQCPDVGVRVTKGRLEHITGCGHLLAAGHLAGDVKAPLGIDLLYLSA